MMRLEVLRSCVMAQVAMETNEAYEVLQEVKKANEPEIENQVRNIWFRLSDLVMEVIEADTEKQYTRIAETAYELGNEVHQLTFHL